MDRVNVRHRSRGWPAFGWQLVIPCVCFGATAGCHSVSIPASTGPGDAPVASAALQPEVAQPPKATPVNPLAAVIPPAVATFPIDLEAALGLAGAENPTIGLAEEAVRASQAR